MPRAARRRGRNPLDELRTHRTALGRLRAQLAEISRVRGDRRTDAERAVQIAEHYNAVVRAGPSGCTSAAWLAHLDRAVRAARDAQNRAARADAVAEDVLAQTEAALAIVNQKVAALVAEAAAPAAAEYLGRAG